MGRQPQIDAAVTNEIIGPFRRRAAIQIGRRADHSKADVGADAHRNHVLGNLLAEAHAGIESLLDDVDELVVRNQLHIDVRIGREQPLELRPQDGADGVIAGADPDGAGRPVLEVPEARKLGFDVVEPRRHGAQQAFARLGRVDAAGVACQQPHAKPALELADGMAEGGLRDAKLGGGLGEGALAADGLEGLEVIEIAALHEWTPLRRACTDRANAK